MKNIDETVRKCMTIMMKNAYFKNTWHSSKLCVRVCECSGQGPMKSKQVLLFKPLHIIAYHCISLRIIAFCVRLRTNSQHSVRFPVPL